MGDIADKVAVGLIVAVGTRVFVAVIVGITAATVLAVGVVVGVEVMRLHALSSRLRLSAPNVKAFRLLVIFLFGRPLRARLRSEIHKQANHNKQ
ncbi:MAG: hypothetical protein IH859_08150 [Chloroflexi bacterium]|nr:hypothetical protein [Chloroflexota bacterium]